MCREMEKVREDVEQRTKMEDIRNIMDYLKCTAEKAMEILRVPERVATIMQFTGIHLRISGT